VNPKSPPSSSTPFLAKTRRAHSHGKKKKKKKKRGGAAGEGRGEKRNKLEKASRNRSSAGLWE
jgi:hypothetical protein